MKFDEQLISDLIKEIRNEQAISPKQKDETFKKYICEGMYSINEKVGFQINYNNDLTARSLLKNYILYANYKRLAEFEELYERDYVSLQIKYNRDSNI